MSLLKSLFGLGGTKSGEPAAAVKQSEHKGFLIEARPYNERGRYQTAGTIIKELNGIRKEHKFIRADTFSTIEEAADFSLTKGRQIVDEMGDRLFA